MKKLIRVTRMMLLLLLSMNAPWSYGQTCFPETQYPVTNSFCSSVFTGEQTFQIKNSENFNSTDNHRNLTVGMWVKIDLDASSESHILTLGQSSSSDSKICIKYCSDGLHMDTEGNNVRSTVVIKKEDLDDGWMYLAFTYQKSADIKVNTSVAKFYINGELERTLAPCNYADDSSGDTYTIINMASSESGSFRFKGDMAYVSVFEEAFSEDTVKLLSAFHRNESVGYKTDSYLVDKCKYFWMSCDSIYSCDTYTTTYRDTKRTAIEFVDLPSIVTVDSLAVRSEGFSNVVTFSKLFSNTMTTIVQEDKDLVRKKLCTTDASVYTDVTAIPGHQYKYYATPIWKATYNGAENVKEGVSKSTDFITIDNRQKATDCKLEEKLKVTYPNVIYKWNIADVRWIDHIDVRRRELGGEFVTIATLTDIATNQTAFSFVNAADPDFPTGEADKTMEFKYLLENGKTYFYDLNISYEGFPDDLPELDSDTVRSSEINLFPVLSDGELNVTTVKTDDNDQAEVKITWAAGPYRAKDIELYKKIGTANFEPLVLSQANKDDSEFTDKDVSGCVNYTYKLVLKSALLAGEMYSTSKEKSVMVNVSMSNAISDLEVSKGYYDERVVLKWNNNGGDAMERIKVERRELGNEANVILAVLENDDNSYVDETASPGVYYEYKVYGEGKCGDGEELSFSNKLLSIGFCQRTGVVAGQISYDGGTAVKGVRVALESGGVSGNVSSHAVEIKEKTGLRLIDTTLTNDFEDGFTIEAWFNIEEYNSANYLFCCQDEDAGEVGFSLSQTDGSGKNYTLIIGGGQYGFTIADSIFTDIRSTPTGYNHFALSYYNSKAKVYCNSQLVCNEENIAYSNTTNISLQIANKYEGTVDEVRLWEVARSQSEIADNYKRLLSGTEAGLEMYWRLDEGVGSQVYDMSNHKGTFNQNHGEFYSDNGDNNEQCSWCEDIPSAENLALVGLTDADGYYIVEGIRYIGYGETFKVTPMLGVHQFSPSSRTMFIGDNSLTQNDKDFNDESSFEVQGTVKYEGIEYPVAGVQILVDGSLVLGVGNKAVETNINGEYIVEVPIGKHIISTSKYGHDIVVAQSVVGDAVMEELSWFFNDNCEKLDFTDNTKVTLVGKIAGGLIEAAKPIESKRNPSVNNIGQYSVTLKGDIDNEISASNGGSTTITIETDLTTGEYRMDLIPEIFNVVKIKPSNGENSAYTFTDLTDIDLSHAFSEEYTLDSIFEETLLYDTKVMSFVGFDTLSTYHKRRDWITRADPKISVENADNSSVLSDAYFFSDEDTVPVYSINDDNSVNWNFGFPVFTSGYKYAFGITVNEEYTNYQTTTVDLVPVLDGKLTIVNNIASNTNSLDYELDSEGKCEYEFWGGLPIVAYPYTQSMNIKLVLANGTAIAWGNNDYAAYIMGSRMSGNNFVTTAPDAVDFILRDPPGSNSYAYIEKGTTVSNTSTMSASFSSSSSVDMNVDFGPSLTTSVGIGAMIETEIDIKAETDISKSCEAKSNGEYATTTATTFKETYSTSSDSHYVGPVGDVFFGTSSNIVYGAAKSVKVMTLESAKASQCLYVNDGYEYQGKTYTIGIDQSLSIAPEFATHFIYTQNHIENYMLGNLERLRNEYYDNNKMSYEIQNNVEPGSDLFLVANDYPDLDASLYVSPHSGPSYVFTPDIVEVDQIVYTLSLSEGQVLSDILDDADLASLNESKFETWSAYLDTIKVVYTSKKDIVSVSVLNYDNDSVYYYNRQIQLWKDILALNEEQKTNAKGNETHSNISFDAGLRYESSSALSTTMMSSISSEITINSSVMSKLGLEINDVGSEVTVETKTGFGLGSVNSSKNETTNKVGYVLSDEDDGDYFTVDILDCKSGNGPVFKTIAGQSSCPYEGEYFTKYYKPGTEVINQPTMQREVPILNISDGGSLLGVPSTMSAEFVLTCSNASESDDDFWFRLLLDGNPQGAIVTVDGMALIAGVSVYVKANQSIDKIVQIKKGQSDIFEYNDINIIMSSLCQYDPTDDALDIADTVVASVGFVKTCSPVEIIHPLDLYKFNRDLSEITVELSNYNLQDSYFKYIYLQKKLATESEMGWKTFHVFANNELSQQGDTTSINQNSSVYYDWTMGDESYNDGEYNLRAVTDCSNGTSSQSSVLTGIKDMIAPQAFTTPEPSDGIYDPSDVISVKFNEAVSVRHQDIKLQSRLNASIGDVHESFVNFSAGTDNVYVPSGVDLKYTPFSVEFWMQRNAIGDQQEVIYAQGGTTGLEIGLYKNMFYMQLGGDTVMGTKILDSTEEWYHLMASFDNAEGKSLHLKVAGADFIHNDFESINSDYFVSGDVVLGNNAERNAGLNAKLHGFNIWSKYLSDLPTEAASGYETGLMAAWAMNDISDDIVPEKVASRNGQLNAVWKVDNEGKSLFTQGNSSYFKINTGAMIFADDADFTIEFWCKVAESEEAMTLFSNGKALSKKGDGQWSISVLPDRTLQIVNDSVFINIEDVNINNNAWHHFALTKKAIGNVSVYVDGNKVYSASSYDYSGFSALNMVLGARYDASGNSEHLDQYTIGRFDELRIFNKYLSQEDLLETMNEELIGDEVGLKAYFPFQERQSGFSVTDNATFNNMTESTSEIAAYFEGEGANNVELVEETPNVKSAIQKQELTFTYLVNNDELVITPSSDPLEIENQKIEVSVSEVKDMNDNQQISPLFWGAFVHRNPVRWDREKMVVDIEVNQESSVSASIVNQSTETAYYTLEGLPAWLTPDVSSGTVDALSSKSIEFEVNQALNIGDYSGVVTLATAEGYEELLNIDVQVRTPAPDWNVDFNQYENSMTIIGQLKIAGILSTDVNDMVAVFNDEKCQGVANLEYLKSRDIYLVNLTVYGTEADDLHLRVWDASKGSIYTSVSPDVVYEINEVIGTPKSPVDIATTDSVGGAIPVFMGWNWLSFNLYSSQLNNADKLLESIASDKGDQIKHHVDGFDNYVRDIGWANTLSFSTAKMYKLKTNDVDTIRLSGLPVITSTAPISIGNGWNWIGFTPQYKMPVSSALAYHAPTEGDVIKSHTQFAMFSEDLGWIGSMNYMQPFEGYMYYSDNSSNVNFKYPQETLFNKSASISTEAEVDKGDDEFAYEYNMTAMLSVSDQALVSNTSTKLLAYNGTTLAGKAEATYANGVALFPMTIGGDSDAKVINFVLVNKETGVSLSALETLAYQPDQIFGSVNDPFELEFTPTSLESLSASTVALIPNPFTDVLNITNIPEGVESVQIYDMQGRQIKVWKDVKTSELEWDGSTGEGQVVSSGTYLLKMHGESYYAPQMIIRE